MRLLDKVRDKIRNFLHISDSQPINMQLTDITDWVTNSYINRVWNWGDKDALEQTYKQLNSVSTRNNFWAASPSQGIVKRHTGIPGNVQSVLTSLVMADMNGINVGNDRQLEWDEITKKINIKDIIEEAVGDTLIIGDGAFKISIDTSVSMYPSIEFVPGDQCEYEVIDGNVKEIRFKEPIYYAGKQYIIEEAYGYGYVRTKVYDNDKEVPLSAIPVLAGREPMVTFDKSFMMATRLMFFKSKRFKNRGKSIYDGKHDAYDSLDETFSQWMDAVRQGRASKYIPQNLIPRNPKTGELMKPNPFDNNFIQIEGDMSENAHNKIEVVQPSIPHDSYVASYITALDLCLQGVISPSTLGIDTKKLDNAEAQREKEKTTLYSRNKIVAELQDKIPKLIDSYFKAYDTLNKNAITDTPVEIPFGEYANPSFESQVETVGNAKEKGIMSIEAAVDELYGDTRDADWKNEEVTRLKAEQGIVEMEEPKVNFPDNMVE
ncbi:MAG: capsid protein [Lachnospiraceae bacterium]